MLDVSRDRRLDAAARGRALGVGRDRRRVRPAGARASPRARRARSAGGGLRRVRSARARSGRPSASGVSVLIIGNTADEERAEAAGIAGIVTRPLTRERLVEAVRRHHPLTERDERSRGGRAQGRVRLRRRRRARVHARPVHRWVLPSHARAAPDGSARSASRSSFRLPGPRSPDRSRGGPRAAPGRQSVRKLPGSPSASRRSPRPIGSRSGGFSGRAGAGYRMTPPRRVLVVDDQDDIREMARLVLTGAGYEVVRPPRAARR